MVWGFGWGFGRGQEPWRFGNVYMNVYVQASYIMILQVCTTDAHLLNETHSFVDEQLQYLNRTQVM